MSELIIDAGQEIPEIDGVGKGYIPRDWKTAPFGDTGFADAFNLPLIPRSEWPDRIADAKRNKSSLQDLCDQAGLWIKNQGSVPYCWVFGVTHCVEIVRLLQGQELIKLSPASVGGPVTGYKSVGGWGTNALRYGVKHGWVPESHWPATAIDRRYDNDETRAMRAKYQCDEWYDVVSMGQSNRQRFDRVMTCVLLGIPTAVAYLNWRHLVMAVEGWHSNGQFGLLIRNSWSERWGDKGTAVIKESYGGPDEAVAPRVVTAA